MQELFYDALTQRMTTGRFSQDPRCVCCIGLKGMGDAAGIERSRRMTELQKELEAAIRQEAYEQAARLRDELKSLQSS